MKEKINIPMVKPYYAPIPVKFRKMEEAPNFTEENGKPIKVNKNLKYRNETQDRTSKN